MLLYQVAKDNTISKMITKLKTKYFEKQGKLYIRYTRICRRGSIWRVEGQKSTEMKNGHLWSLLMD